MIIENEKTLSYKLLTNPNISNSIDWTQESCYFENQDSISPYLFKIDQTPSFENHIDILASYHFLKLNLSMNAILNLNLIIQFHFLTQY